jgi:hypothetical protein
MRPVTASRGVTTRHPDCTALLHLCRASGRVVSTLDFSSVSCTGSRRVPGHSVVRRDYPSRGHNGYISPTPHVWVPRHVARHVARLVTRPIVDFFAYAARPGASASCAARRQLLRLAQARRRLFRLRHASGCLGTSHDTSRASSSTTSPTPRVRVPRHVARLVVDYFTSRRFVVDYFAYAARPGASARRAAHCQLLRLRRMSGCLGTSHSTSRGSSRRSSSTTSPTPRVRVPRHVALVVTRLVAPLVVDYFAYAARLGASARRAACCTARRRLLRLRRVSVKVHLGP